MRRDEDEIGVERLRGVRFIHRKGYAMEIWDAATDAHPAVLAMSIALKNGCELEDTEDQVREELSKILDNVRGNRSMKSEVTDDSMLLIHLAVLRRAIEIASA